MVIKKEHILLLLLLCCVLLFSCTSTDKKIDKHSNKNVEQENKNNKDEEELLEKGYNLPVSGSEKTEAENSCKEVMELVSDLYKNADKGTSLNIVIKSKVIRQMVKLLGNAGYQARCNEAYSNMENYQKILIIKNGKKAKWISTIRFAALLSLAKQTRYIRSVHFKGLT